MNVENIVNLIKNNPVKLAHALGFTLLTDLHNGWIKEFIFGKEDKTLKAHRGSYKTVAVSVALAFIIVLFPLETTLFLRKTDADVTEVVRRVSAILKTDLMKAIVFAIYGVELKLLKDTNDCINTNLNIGNRGTPQLMGMGVNGSLTGKHFERIFTDDIVNLKDRISPAEREHTKIVYMELQNVLNRGGRIVNTGTTWHKEDAFSIMPEAEIYTCFETGLMNETEIQKVRKSMTPSLFAANYELKCIADENALFTNPNFATEADIEKIFNGQGQIDAGYGGEDFSAFTIMKYVKEQNKIYALGKLWHKHIDNCLPEIKQLHSKLKCGTIHCEKNADKGYLHKELKNYDLPSIVYNEFMNKHIKITTYLYKYWDIIHWLPGTDAEYLNQILDYTEEAEHDDAPDSGSSLCRKIFNKAGIHSYSDIGI